MTKSWKEQRHDHGSRPDPKIDCAGEDQQQFTRPIGCGGMNWIHLAQDMDKWWNLVNTVMNFKIP
jgi:hypothetical protein